MDGTNEAERIALALSGVQGVKLVTRGWPQRKSELPRVAVQLAGERGVERFDDAEYLTELEYYVRTFAQSAAELDALCIRVRECMAGLGYARVFAWETADENACQRAERYQTVR